MFQAQVLDRASQAILSSADSFEVGLANECICGPSYIIYSMWYIGLHFCGALLLVSKYPYFYLVEAHWGARTSGKHWWGDHTTLGVSHLPSSLQKICTPCWPCVWPADCQNLGKGSSSQCGGIADNPCHSCNDLQGQSKGLENMWQTKTQVHNWSHLADCRDKLATDWKAAAYSELLLVYCMHNEDH